MVLGFRKRAAQDSISAVQTANSSSDAVSSSNEKSGMVVDAAVAVDHLRDFTKLHRLDPNLPLEELDQAEEALKTGDIEKEIAVERVLVGDDSPYPEV
jgi:hypothetical protein